MLMDVSVVMSVIRRMSLIMIVVVVVVIVMIMIVVMIMIMIRLAWHIFIEQMHIKFTGDDTAAIDCTLRQFVTMLWQI